MISEKDHRLSDSCNQHRGAEGTHKFGESDSSGRGNSRRPTQRWVARLVVKEASRGVKADDRSPEGPRDESGARLERQTSQREA